MAFRDPLALLGTALTAVFLAAAFLGASGGGTAAGPAHARARAAAFPPLDILVRQFDLIAFDSEFGGAARAGRLVKWAGPVRVRLRGLDAEADRDAVRAHLALLARLTGLDMRLVRGWEAVPPNMTVTFVAAPPGPGGAPCVTYLEQDNSFVVRRARILILAGAPALRRHCIVEEITQALGLADDSLVIRRSIFNDLSRRQRLAPWDEIMVRTLYDPRLRPGMTRARALPLVRRIIARRMAAAAP